MAQGNTIRTRLENGERLVGGWITMASPIAAEIMGMAGFDFLMIDQEHGPGDTLAAIQLQQAIAAGGGSARFMRVYDSETQLIKRALDTGIDGLMVPMVETADEAVRVVAACLFPPEGVRGVAPGNVRAAAFGYKKDEFMAAGGSDVFVICQVETATTVANLDDIAKVDGVDMLFIGRNDLASSVGHLANTNHGEAVELRQEAERRIKQSGRKMGGIPGPGDDAAAMFERGYDLVIAIADHAILRDGAVACVTSLKG